MDDATVVRICQRVTHFEKNLEAVLEALTVEHLGQFHWNFLVGKDNARGWASDRVTIVQDATCEATVLVETPDMTTNVAPVAGARVVVRPAEEGDEHEATTDADGLARVALAPGSYTIRVVECPGAMSLPKEDAAVTVREGAFASAELVCDTGIR